MKQKLICSSIQIITIFKLHHVSNSCNKQHWSYCSASDYIYKRDYAYNNILKFKESLAEIGWDWISNANIPCPTMLHSEQKYAQFCSKWSSVGYGTGAFGICELGHLLIMYFCNMLTQIYSICFPVGNTIEDGKVSANKFHDFLINVEPSLTTIRPTTLTHWGRDKMDDISQTTFSSAFSWIKIYEFRLKFHWGLFLRVQLTIFQHWFR